MIDPEKDKLLNRAAQPEEWHPHQEKMSEWSSTQFVRKNKAHRCYKKEKINQPEIGDLHDRLIGFGQFRQFVFPVENPPELAMEHGKTNAV